MGIEKPRLQTMLVAVLLLTGCGGPAFESGSTEPADDTATGSREPGDMSSGNTDATNSDGPGGATGNASDTGGASSTTGSGGVVRGCWPSPCDTTGSTTTMPVNTASTVSTTTGSTSSTGAENCECTEGACCDGCHFLSSATVCASDAPYTSRCDTSDPKYQSVIFYHGDIYCTGESAECNGVVIDNDHQSNEMCPSGTECRSTPPGTCEPVGAGGSGGETTASGSGGSGGTGECECTEGECCDGCNLSTFGTLCAHDYIVLECKDGDIYTNYLNVFCSGESPDCDGHTHQTKYSFESCDNGCTDPVDEEPRCL